MSWVPAPKRTGVASIHVVVAEAYVSGHMVSRKGTAARMGVLRDEAIVPCLRVMLW